MERVGLRAARVMCAARRTPHDWRSPDWNWGYARGTAHDAAFELRRKLSKREARENWIRSVDTMEWDEGLLCLALRIQRSVNYGRDSRNFGEVLDALAAGTYGSATSAEPELLAALRGKLGEADGLDREGEDGRDVLVACLQTLGFVDDGL